MIRRTPSYVLRMSPLEYAAQSIGRARALRDNALQDARIAAQTGSLHGTPSGFVLVARMYNRAVVDELLRLRRLRDLAQRVAA